MYRVVFLIGLCGLLAQALPTRDTSLADLAAEPFDRTRTYGARYPETEPVERTETRGWPTYEERLGQWYGFGERLSQTMDDINNWINDVVNGGSVEPEVAVDPRPTPSYKELCKSHVSYGYEARSYNRSVWVSVAVVSRLSDVAVMSAQPRLLKYFNGANDQNLIIDMTKPIRLKSPSPTSQWGPGFEEKTFVYSMYLPPELHENPPKPNDTDLFISDEQPTQYFAIKFSSYTFAMMNFLKLGELKDLLNEQKERFVRSYYFVDVYDPPSQLTNRRNEVLLLFNPNVDKPNCAGVTSDPASSSYPIAVAPETMYKQLCNSSKYDARLYSRAVWVSTTVNSISSAFGSFVAYTKLDNFFNDYNDQGLKIQKTEPVRITQAWPKSVYDPVIYREYTYSYYLPAKLYDNVPQPLDPDVFILDEPAAIRFARNFSGYTFDFQNKHELQMLENLLIQSGEQYLSSEPWAINEYYNSSEHSYLRKDVTVYMDPLAKHPTCEANAEFPPCLHRDKECPSYRVLKNLTSDIQRRHISDNLYAIRRTNTCNMSTAYSEAYMPLHRYFRGANNRNETIHRLPPVVLVHKSKDNPPEGCDFTYNLMFYLPAEKHHNAPAPTEDGVELIRIEARDTFVITFEESSTDVVVDAQVTKLRTELDTLGYCYNEDEFAVATYDAPWRPRPHRHEIWIAQDDCVRPIPLKNWEQIKCFTNSAEESPQYSVQVSGCDAGAECPMYETVHSYATFKQRVYGQSTWVCKETTSCDVEEAFNEANAPIYEYYQTCYDVEPKTRPIMSFLSLPNFLSDGCNKVIRTCAYLPETGRLPLIPPQGDLTLENNPWLVTYVATLQGEPTVSNIYTSMATLLQDMIDADIVHNNNVFVARYTLPGEDGAPHTEIGAMTNTLPYYV